MKMSPSNANRQLWSFDDVVIPHGIFAARLSRLKQIKISLNLKEFSFLDLLFHQEKKNKFISRAETSLSQTISFFLLLFDTYQNDRKTTKKLLLQK